MPSEGRPARTVFIRRPASRPALRHTDRTKQHRLLGAGIRRPFVPEKICRPRTARRLFDGYFVRRSGIIVPKHLFNGLDTVYFPRNRRKRPARPPLGNGRIRRRPACLRPLPDRHFLAPRLPPAAGKLRCRPVYRRIVYAAAAVLHAGRNQRHRFERRPKNTPDRARHLGRAGGKPAAAGACRTVRRRARRGGCLCRLILAVFCFQDRKLLPPVAAAQTPAALYAHIVLPGLLGGLHLLRHAGKLPPVCRRMGGISGRLHPAPPERFAQTVSLFEKQGFPL